MARDWRDLGQILRAALHHRQGKADLRHLLRRLLVEEHARVVHCPRGLRGAPRQLLLVGELVANLVAACRVRARVHAVYGALIATPDRIRVELGLGGVPRLKVTSAAGRKNLWRSNGSVT